MATTTVTSKQFTLNLPDIWKGLIVSVLAPVFMLALSSLTNNSFHFDWQLMGTTAASAFLGYILKNFLTPSAVVIKDVSDDQVKAVKDGDAKATITSA